MDSRVAFEAVTPTAPAGIDGERSLRLCACLQQGTTAGHHDKER